MRIREGGGGRENWVAVATVINDCMNSLKLPQKVLAERSGVSQAVVRELQYNTNERRRSRRTLEALSVALGLHPDHLKSVSLGIEPLPVDYVEETELAKLERIEKQVGLILEKVEGLRGCQCGHPDRD
ncbi:helix-turn-helix domain-containing protein [Actinokineospora globicatena]|uniref:helix-turn-helix domain-containing protein n=1 Tax=Actinokineospora globicatena TaxID=103729 RepID=UPI0020A571AF|nr:helix-turn-helix transcriptional regulator [Actinokineospora globicatena]MCP2304728.1 hypothetical protein [Actinokineospora globicatena]GLW77896.1 hypothetical protein Aglo01_23780 [Actinokineospora globicatena]GLW85437.1 hypothetical protein Aglo02_30770 [Actinokineospora globicatena]